MILLKKHLSYDRDSLYEKVGWLLIAAFAALLLIRAFLGAMWYAEIDSNALPLISLQYRGSILMNESDLVRAQEDFPTLYAGINTYEDLRSGKLIQTEGGWMTWYFPIYPLFCLPVKLLLTVCSVDQDRCFFVTNALLITLALCYVQAKLKASSKQKLLALILLILSPIALYSNFLCYEAFIFSMLTISLVEYYNQHYKASAFLLALAGMSNSTVMAVGIVMIAEYFCKILYHRNGVPLGRLIQSNMKETIKYGICFTPCLVPIIAQRYFTGGIIFSGMTDFSVMGTRFLEYIFDPTLGLFSFAPFTIILFLVLSVAAVCRKDIRGLPWMLFLLGTVAAFSLMFHINCGMIYCARYLVWSYPIIPLFLATVGYKTIKSISWSHILYAVAIFTSSLLLVINMPTALNAYTFNPVTSEILEVAPMIYNPYSATFYCRTLHVDGAYSETEPTYYCSPKTDEVRKLIFKAEPGQADRVLKELTGSDEAVADLRARLAAIKLDGKFHYLNYPVWGKYQLQVKTLEALGQLKENAVLASASNFNLFVDGRTQSFAMPISIRNNTVYKIELELAEDFDFDLSKTFFVDFYRENYDNGEQEKGNFLVKGRCSYTFYFDSGDIGGESLDINARIIDFTKKTESVGMGIERFVITEMKKEHDTEQLGTDSTTLLDAQELTLNSEGEYLSSNNPITIKENTQYRITLVLPDSFDFSAPEIMFVDFYRENYDNCEQEADQFLIENQYFYTFYFDSGDIGGETLDINARIIYFPKEADTEIPEIKCFRVEEISKTSN